MLLPVASSAQDNNEDGYYDWRSSFVIVNNAGWTQMGSADWDLVHGVARVARGYSVDGSTIGFGSLPSDPGRLHAISFSSKKRTQPGAASSVVDPVARPVVAKVTVTRGRKSFSTTTSLDAPLYIDLRKPRKSHIVTVEVPGHEPFVYETVGGKRAEITLSRLP